VLAAAHRGSATSSGIAHTVRQTPAIALACEDHIVAKSSRTSVAGIGHRPTTLSLT
jgi:hypothetical protein